MNCNCSMCKDYKPFDMPEEIINEAIDGNLVVFCGAGISTESKKVLPYTFYKSVQDDLKITDNTLSFSELMQRYCDLPNGRKKLLKKIHDRFNYIHSFPELERTATMFHRELADLYMIQTIITTNWDTYFEDYCDAIPITIPSDFAFWDDKSRYVLKIHGSIDNLSTVVATSKDYQKCLDSLQKGIIGATLKSILATKTVIFIGFSFGDEDFNQIMNYLSTEMGELYPHIYIVTLDEKLKEHINYENTTCIVTDGTYFIQALKNKLYEKKIITNTHCAPEINMILEKMRSCHSKASEINIKKYPCAIYNLFYQDGVIHSLERFLNTHSGEYNCPNRIPNLCNSYQKIIDEYHEYKNYADEAYFEGYLSGLALITICENDLNDITSFPFFYLPNAKQDLLNYDTFVRELERVSLSRDKYNKLAKAIISKNNEDDIVLHHPPY